MANTNIQEIIGKSIKIETAKGLIFKEIYKYGFKAFLEIWRDDKKIGQFYFNMTGYNSDFSLYNAEGQQRQFGEKGKTTVIREFKQAISKGFIYLKPF